MPRIVQLSMFDGKVCSRCNLLFPADTYPKRCLYCRLCYRKDQRERGRRAYYANAEEARRKALAWQRAHADVVNKRRKSRYQENKERLRADALARYHRAPERRQETSRKWKLANRARVNQQRREWNRRHPDRVREWGNRSYALRKAAPGAHTLVEWRALKSWFGDICLRCGTHDSLTVDHVIPLARGGTDNIDNLQPLCFSCNASKKATTIDYRDPARLAAFLSSLNA